MKKTVITALITTAISGAAFAQIPSGQHSQDPAMAQEFAKLTQSITALPQQISSSISGDLGSIKTFFESHTTKHSLKYFLHKDWYGKIHNDLNQIQATNTAQATVEIPEKVTTSDSSPTSADSTSEKIKMVSEKLPVAAAAAHTASNLTYANVADTLAQPRYDMLAGATHSEVKDEAKKMLTTGGTPYNTHLDKNSTAALTLPTGVVHAADDLYIVHLESALKSGQNVSNFQLVKKPTTTAINNLPFSFTSVITPIAYSQDQLADAKQFVIFAAQSTQNLAKDTGLSTIDNDPSKLNTLVTSAVYQKYKLTIRTIVAIRSMLINTLNQLIAERTPMPGLTAAAGGKVGGVANLTQQEINAKEASPLQVEAYQANNRIEDPKWYGNVTNESPAAVQREMLIVLAEMEHQNYEAHLDRERILSAITALGLESNIQTTSLILKEEAPKVNEVINPAANK